MKNPLNQNAIVPFKGTFIPKTGVDVGSRADWELHDIPDPSTLGRLLRPRAERRCEKGHNEDQRSSLTHGQDPSARLPTPILTTGIASLGLVVAWPIAGAVENLTLGRPLRT